MSNIQSTTGSDIERDVLTADRPVLVDFWAPWCPPCRMLEPTLTRLAETRDDIRLLKVDIDAERELAARYQVRNIPSLMLFRDGEPAANHVGVAEFAELKRWLDSTSAVAGEIHRYANTFRGNPENGSFS